MKKFFLTIVFLLTLLAVKSQNLNGFVVVAENGDCASNSKIKVTLPTSMGFPVGTNFLVKLRKPNNPNEEIKPGVQDDTNPVVFTSLESGTFTITIVNQNTGVTSSPRTQVLNSSYQTISFLGNKIQQIAPNCTGSGNDGRVSFTIAPGAEGPFKVTLKKKPSGEVVYQQTHTKPSASAPLAVDIQGTNAMPITLGEYDLTISDLKPPLGCGGERTDPINIVAINDINCVEFFKNDEGSQILMSDDCKMRITIQMQRKDLVPITTAQRNAIRAMAGAAIVKRYNASGVLVNTYDITPTFDTNWNHQINQGYSFYTPYEFEEDDTVEVEINIGSTPIKERFKLAKNIVDVTKNKKRDGSWHHRFEDDWGSISIGTGNQSDLKLEGCAAPPRLYMWVGWYYRKIDFQNEANPSDVAGYGAYKWMHHTNRIEASNPGPGYYFEIYKWTGGSVNMRPNIVYDNTNWQLLTPGTDYNWLASDNAYAVFDDTPANKGWYKVKIKAKKAGSTVADYCYEPQRAIYMEPKPVNMASKFYTIEINRGAFEGTASLRRWLSALHFTYPLTVTFDYIDDGKVGTTRTHTFQTRLALQQSQTTESITFPVVREVKSPLHPDTKYFEFGDFPAGNYRVTLTDACGNTATRDMNFDTPMVYDDKLIIDHGCGVSGSAYYKVSAQELGSIRTTYFQLHKKQPNGTWKSIETSYLREYTFTNLSPGEYKIVTGTYRYARVKMFNISNGVERFDLLDPTSYINGYSLLRPNAGSTLSWVAEKDRGRIAHHTYEVPFTIAEAGDMFLERVGTSCTTGQGSGLIAVKVTNPENIRYPLRFELFKQGENAPIQVSPEFDESSGATSWVFQNLPDGAYDVRASDKCKTTGKYDVNVVANTYSEPTISHSVTSLNPCNGDEVKLTFSGSDALFDIEWFRVELDGSRTSIGQGKEITQVVSQTTQFVVRHSLKTAGICASGVGEKTTTISFAPDTQSPVITGCPSAKIEVNASVGKCTGVVTWNAITATDNCSIATSTQSHHSGDEFPIGTTTVTYTFTDTSGNVATCTFLVEVKSNALLVDVNAEYIDGTGAPLAGDLALNQEFQYKINYQNVGQEDVTTSTLIVKLTDNPYIEVSAPTVIDASVGAFVPTFTNVGRTYTFVIPKETLQHNGAVRTIYFPLRVKGTYQQIGQPCKNILTSEYKMEFEGGNQNCKIAKQTKTGQNTALISTQNNERSELFCVGSNLTLTATPGYDTYKWYKDGVHMPSQVSNTYQASQAGVYKVEKTINCNGVNVVSYEIINFQDNSVGPDPIRVQANGGAICAGNGAWTSHFILCAEPSRTIRVDYVDSQLVWQRYTGTRNDDCPDYNEASWVNDAKGNGNTFVADTQGRYRLRVSSSNGCTADYYFNVYVNSLSGEIVQPVGDITDYQPGHFTVKMATQGITYIYTLRDASNNVVTGYDQITGTHVQKFDGISQPGDYYVEITSSEIANCGIVLRTKLNLQKHLKVKAVPRGWVDCNNYKIKFEAQGGKTPYQFAIWKIDGVQQYPDYGSIPSFDVATIPDGANVVEANVNVTQPGKYIFIVKDANGAFAETSELEIYPEGINGYTINTKDIVCGLAANSGQVSVTFNSSLQNIVTKLHKLDNGGNITATQSNSSGFYDQLTAGKYRLEIIIKRGTENCSYISPVTIKQSENTLRAYAGVAEDISCDTNSPKRYKVHINNVSGGSGTGYTFSSNGVDYGTSNEVYLNGSGKVYVKDSNGCPLEIDVNITPLTPPTIAVSNVEYDCIGRGTFTITASPAGTYQYEVVGAGVNLKQSTNTFTLPQGNYSIFVHYKPDGAALMTPNYLYKEDFGVGEDTCDSSISMLTCKVNQQLVNNQYVITKQVQGIAEWISPTPLDASSTPNGRYLAVNASADSGNMAVLYQKTIKNIIVGQEVKVSLKLHNLLAPTYIGGKNPNLDLILKTSGGVEKARIGLGSIPANGNWIDKNITFPSSSVSGQEMIFAIQNKESSTIGTDIAIDDIVIWQDTKLCDVRLESASVQVEQGKEFKVLGTPNDATCSGEKGTLNVKIENRMGSNVEYSTDNINWLSLPLTNISTDVDSGVITNLEQVTDGKIFIRKQNDQACVKQITYSIRVPETMSVTTTILREAKCGTLNADLEVTATGGVRPYQSATIAGISVPMVNNVATFSGANAVATGSHIVQITDVNGCVATTTLEVKAPKTLQAEAVNLEPCATNGAAKVQINVIEGNGNYQFSKDGGNSFFTPNIVGGASYVFEGLQNGVHNFVVRDASQCTQNLSLTIHPSLRLQVSDPVTHLTCAPGSRTEYELKATGGNIAIAKEFLWSADGVNYTDTPIAGITFVQTGNTAVFTTNIESTYYFQVRYQYEPGNYCSVVSGPYQVKVSKPKFKTNPTPVDILCGGTSTGKILMSQNNIEGGEAPYRLQLNDGVTTTIHPVGDIIGLAAGDYQLTIIDNGNCLSEVKDITINESEPLTVSITTERMRCRGTGEGVLLGSAKIKFEQGGMSPFSLEVKFKDVFGAPAIYTGNSINLGDEISIPNLIPHDYVYQIVDAKGCTTNGIITIEGTTDKMITRATGITPGCATSTLIVEAYNEGGLTIADGTYWAAIYKVGETTIPSSVPTGAVLSFVDNGTIWFKGSAATVTTTLGVPVQGMRVHITDLKPGVHYKFIVYDASTGCYIIDDATITPPALSNLTAVTTTIPTTCASADDGKVSFTISGVMAGTTQVDYQVYTYSVNDDVYSASGTAAISGGIGNATITGLPAGKYYILFTEKPSGCINATAPFVIEKSDSELKFESVTSTNDNCLGNKGNIDVDVKGGKAPYSFHFHNMVNPLPTPSALETLLTTSTYISANGIFRHSGVPSGTYKVYVRDDSGCIKEEEISVDMDTTPVISSIEVVNPCAEESDFSVRLNLSSVGVGQHRYRVNAGAWQPITISKGMTSVVLPRKFTSSVTPYTIELEDANTCPTLGAVTIYAPLTYDISSTIIKCGVHSIVMTLSNLAGGSGNYTYNVNRIRVETDEFGNENQISLPIVTSAVAVAGVTYPIVIGSAMAPVVAGEYEIQVFDSAYTNACPVSKRELVRDSKNPEIELVSLTQPVCYNGVGTIRVKATPVDLQPLSFEIVSTSSATLATPILPTSSGADYATFENLPSSDLGIEYTISVKSAYNQCAQTLKAIIKSPSELTMTPNVLTITDYKCDRANESVLPILSFDLTQISGGTQSYTQVAFYQDGMATALNTQLIQDGVVTYTYQLPYHVTTLTDFYVKVKDANGCETDSPKVALSPSLILKDVDVRKVTGIDCITNVESVSVELNTITTYAGEQIVYEVIQRDRNGVESVFATKTSNVRIETFNLPVGNYTIWAINPLTGCRVDKTYDVHEPNTFVVQPANIRNVICHGTASGEVTLNFVDTRLTDGDQALAGFSYKIIPVASPMTIISSTATGTATYNVMGLSAGVYQVEVTALSNGCTANTTFEIVQSESPITAVATETYGVTCTNDKGEVMVSVKGGRAPYQVVLSSPSVNQVKTGGDAVNNTGQFLFTGLKSDPVTGMETYNISITDDSGCTMSNLTSIVLSHPTPITAVVTVTQNETCPDAQNGIITISNAMGGSGTPTFNYVLQGTSTSVTQTSPVFTNLPPDTYTIGITDAWNCDVTLGTYQIAPAVPLDLTYMRGKLTVCNGEKDAWLQMQITGGKAPYEAKIINTKTQVVVETLSNITPIDPVLRIPAVLGAGQYQVILTDTYGCTMSPVYEFEVKEVPNLAATAEQVQQCESGYKTWIEVKFKHSVNFHNLTFQFGNGVKRVFSRTQNNIGYIDANAFASISGTQTLTIHYDDVDPVTGENVMCSFTLTENIFVEQILPLDQVQRVVSNTTLNVIEVKGKDGKAPYTYVFNGKDQGSDGVYQMKITDPEEYIDGKRYKIIEVAIYDAVGCVVTKTFKELYYDITIPNFFTPDGDGINDTWTPRNLDDYPYAKTHIFDRYGRKVQTIGRGQSWDGKYKGKDLPSGDYWYILELNSDIDARKFNGNFTLYR